MVKLTYSELHLELLERIEISVAEGLGVNSIIVCVNVKHVHLVEHLLELVGRRCLTGLNMDEICGLHGQLLEFIIKINIFFNLDFFNVCIALFFLFIVPKGNFGEGCSELLVVDLVGIEVNGRNCSEKLG